MVFLNTFSFSGRYTEIIFVAVVEIILGIFATMVQKKSDLEYTHTKLTFKYAVIRNTNFENTEFPINLNSRVLIKLNPQVCKRWSLT